MHRRAQPWLGTLVAVSVQAHDQACFNRASDAAFARIRAIHRAMSFHEAGSDVRAIARASEGAVLKVSTDTWHTLALALEMEQASSGVFNAALAPALVARAQLPWPDDAQPAGAHSLHEGIALEADGHVRILASIWIDLGGIAKGVAVDAAVDVLIAQGVPTGIVNAGGDLKVFGDMSQTLWVRWPDDPAQLMPMAEIQDLACATTGGYFLAGDASAALGHPAIIGQAMGLVPWSVSVMAASCAVADALTKVVWLDPQGAPALLARYDARAALLDGQGHVQQI